MLGCTLIGNKIRQSTCCCACHSNGLLLFELRHFIESFCNAWIYLLNNQFFISSSHRLSALGDAGSWGAGLACMHGRMSIWQHARGLLAWMVKFKALTRPKLHNKDRNNPHNANEGCGWPPLHAGCYNRAVAYAGECRDGVRRPSDVTQLGTTNLAPSSESAVRAATGPLEGSESASRNSTDEPYCSCGLTFEPVCNFLAEGTHALSWNFMPRDFLRMHLYASRGKQLQLASNDAAPFSAGTFVYCHPLTYSLQVTSMVKLTATSAWLNASMPQWKGLGRAADSQQGCMQQGREASASWAQFSACDSKCIQVDGFCIF